MRRNEAILKACNKYPLKERKPGRYYASELYMILKGKLKPADFFKAEEKDFVGSCNILEGELREQGEKLLFDISGVKYEYQAKAELLVNGFVIVVKPDFMLENKIIECKSPVKMPDAIKEWHKPQLEAQYRAFGRPVEIWYVQDHFKCRAFKYVPNDKYWELILKKVTEFHKKLTGQTSILDEPATQRQNQGDTPRSKRAPKVS